jgi:hypothetical protein
MGDCGNRHDVLRCSAVLLDDCLHSSRVSATRKTSENPKRLWHDEWTQYARTSLLGGGVDWPTSQFDLFPKDLKAYAALLGAAMASSPNPELLPLARSYSTACVFGG